ncbi:U3 small nucleolar ribonucleoprotein [Wolffia australiana]
MEGGVLEASSAAMEALEHLRSASPPRYLAKSEDLALLARKASTHLFSSLLSSCPKALPIDRLLADESFDPEQIWYQIELQLGPIVSALDRDIRRFEKLDPDDLLGLRGPPEDDLPEKEDDLEMKDVEEDNSEDGSGEDDDEDEAEDEEEDEDDDDFLIEHEYNPPDDGIGDGDQDPAIFAKYDDFFGDNSKKSSRNEMKNSKGRSLDKFDEEESLGDSDADDHQEDDEDLENQDQESLSTFEKQSRNLQAEIERIETENLAPKNWTMTGEVAAAKRPKNSALEVDLDFEHNRSRPPIVTEETTSIIEDVILKRIREGHFDDVQRRLSLPSKAPKEVKELDDNKSKKGLAEMYEEEYAQSAGLASVPLSTSDELKKEASFLFKKLCLKLDALSHFHFAPKPVIEDMSVQANIPALAMEEVAPLVVSDAAMLAPEEIYSGKSNVKEETELTQADRKRRRAKKKRKFKAMVAQKTAKKPRKTTNVDQI